MMQPAHSMGIYLLFGVVLTVAGADDLVVDNAEAEETKGQRLSVPPPFFFFFLKNACAYNEWLFAAMIRTCTS